MGPIGHVKQWDLFATLEDFINIAAKIPYLEMKNIFIQFQSDADQSIYSFIFYRSCACYA